MAKNRSLLSARTRASSSTGDAQARNRQWWEELPMTYVDWDSECRIPQDRESFLELERQFLGSNPWIADHVDFSAKEGLRILEIGCGAGAASCLFAKAGADVAAIDLTRTAVEMTRTNARAQSVRVKVLRMDAENVGLQSGCFENILAWGVLHHTRDPSAAFKEVARLLAPGGEGVIMVYNRRSLRYYLKGLFWLAAKGKVLRGYSLGSVQGFFTDGYFHRHYTAKELLELLAKAGLETRRVCVTHMSKKMIPAVPKRLDDFLKKRFGWLLVAEFVRQAPRSDKQDSERPVGCNADKLAGAELLNETVGGHET